jgi:hypothetical protein
VPEGKKSRAGGGKQALIPSATAFGDFDASLLQCVPLWPPRIGIGSDEGCHRYDMTAPGPCRPSAHSIPTRQTLDGTPVVLRPAGGRIIHGRPTPRLLSFAIAFTRLIDQGDGRRSQSAERRPFDRQIVGVPE